MAAVLEEWGNPSSIHQAGQRAKELLERARRQVAGLINAKPQEIYFTSCGTESNNWALRGLLAANKRKGSSLDSPPKVLGGSLGTPPHGQPRGAPHIIISAIEHPSVTLVAKRLALDGADLTILSVDAEGVVAPSALKAVLKPETVLVSIMLANGEVGTIEPIQELAAIAHEHGALFHTDAVAAAGHWPIDVRQLGVDALSLAANQFYGPPGAAVLFVREGVRILPLLEGGGQETGARSGTEALPAIVGLGMAAELAKQRAQGTGPATEAGYPRSRWPTGVPRAVGERPAPRHPSPDSLERLAQLRNRLRDELQERIEHLRLNGSWTSRLPHNLHICIEGVSSESLVLGLDQAGIAAGLGSACNSKAMRPSHVLKAMGLTDEQAKGALVLTVGVPTTDEEIDRALEIIPTVVKRLRNVTLLTSRS